MIPKAILHGASCKGVKDAKLVEYIRIFLFAGLASWWEKLS